ncbi:TonB family protein [Pseudodesulfovibrio mercurii]|uniref:TonB family protein n=1 Tax=Pseudodesulfovibrio mercurii TaxID=641491 RepID=F0JEJ4_9BACT|nr:TonB family protein [Pseudodesulfovibrio mercurii]EGB14723.1 TonB family protein [Pseudodesulfovibrio mercurii]
MTSRQTIWTCLVISLFLHWLLLEQHWHRTPVPSGETIVVPTNFDLSVSTPGTIGLSLEQGVSGDQEKTDHEDAARRLRQQALKRFLAQVHSAVEHNRRPPGSDLDDLIGNARYRFRILPDDTFSGIVMLHSSGNPRLDAAARKAIQAASGNVKRPAILQGQSWTIAITVKYQYSL